MAENPPTPKKSPGGFFRSLATRIRIKREPDDQTDGSLRHKARAEGMDILDNDRKRRHERGSIPDFSTGKYEQVPDPKGPQQEEREMGSSRQILGTAEDPLNSMVFILTFAGEPDNRISAELRFGTIDTTAIDPDDYLPLNPQNLARSEADYIWSRFDGVGDILQTPAAVDSASAPQTRSTPRLRKRSQTSKLPGPAGSARKASASISVSATSLTKPIFDDPQRYSPHVEQWLKSPGLAANSKNALPTQNVTPSTGTISSRTSYDLQVLDDVAHTVDGYKIIYDTSVYLETTGPVIMHDEAEHLDDIRSWMFPIRVRLRLKEATIGSALGLYVRRNLIKQNFHVEFENLTQYLNRIPADIFDRYGRLRPELSDNVRPWGIEVDMGDLLLVQIIEMDPGWHRKDWIETMIEGLVYQCVARGETPAFIVANPSSFAGAPGNATAAYEGQFSSLDPTKRADPIIPLLETIRFSRIGGSCFFGRATDSARSSQQQGSPTSDDITHQLNDILRVSPNDYYEAGDRCEDNRKRLESMFPLHFATLDSYEEECLDLYQAIGGTTAFNDVDDLRRNVLHFAAWSHKSRCVEWIMENAQFLDKLLSARSLRGYTPLEELESQLDGERIKSGQDFEGFPEAAIDCLAALRDTRTLDLVERRRLALGCTCKACVDGYLSHRMIFALECVATRMYGNIKSVVRDKDGWSKFKQSLLTNIHPEIQKTLELSKNFQKGFANLFHHVGNIMSQGIVSSRRSIRNQASQPTENLHRVQGLLYTNGTVEAVLRIVIDSARDHDEWAGGGDMPDEFKEQNGMLITCRNDHEYDLVARMLGAGPMRPFQR